MLKAYLTRIADRFRAYLGTTEKVNAQDFVAKLEEVHCHGIEVGQRVGKQAEYDRFWDIYQENGTKGNYRCAFCGYGWTEENFYPKYNIGGDSNAGYQTFNFFNQNSAYHKKIDLAQRLKDCGVTYDSSKSIYMENTFYYANISRTPEVSTISCANLQTTFGGPYIETVDKLILRDDGSQTFPNTFLNATALKNITIEGIIGNNIDFHYSPLTVESMKNIITCLKDYSGTTGTHTVTFKADRETMLSDDDKSLATDKGWTLVWS